MQNFIKKKRKKRRRDMIAKKVKFKGPVCLKPLIIKLRYPIVVLIY